MLFGRAAIKMAEPKARAAIKMAEPKARAAIARARLLLLRAVALSNEDARGQSHSNRVL